MERVMLIDHSISSIGLLVRTKTIGEESKLVDEFIDYYIHVFLKNNKVNNMAIFLEPKLVSGFPDIVFAIYSPGILDNWSEARDKLMINDLKILAQLLATNGSTEQNLVLNLKLTAKSIAQSIERLHDANMISINHGLWKPVKKKYIYSINKLVSVEAKISNNQKLAEQSFLNMWFASQSYALVRSSRSQTDKVYNFEKQGIGLYCKNNGFEKIVEARKLSSPSSYQSLLFNEWVGRILTHV